MDKDEFEPDGPDCTMNPIVSGVGTENHNFGNDTDDNAKDRILWYDKMCKNYKPSVYPNNVDSSDLAVLQKYYGRPVAWYLENCNSGLRKTKTGAFMMERPECFATCVDLASKHREEKVRCNLHRSHRKKSKGMYSQLPVQPGWFQRDLRKSSTENEQSNQKSQSEQNGMKQVAGPKTCRQKLNVATTLTIEFKIPMADTHGPAKPFDFSKMTRNRRKRELDAKDLYNHAMNTPIDGENLVNHSDFSEQIQTILAQMQKQHWKFRYFAELENILKGKNGEDSKDVLGVTLMQFLVFVYEVFAKVIPRSLFGSNRNVKILRKVLKACYLSPFRSSINLEQCIDSLDMSKIPWLEAYENPSLKLTVLAKITKWIFESYFFRIFEAVFREQKTLDSEKRILLSRERWNRFERDYIESKIRLACIKKICQCRKHTLYRLNHTPSVTMFLYPKSKGVRRIHIPEVEPEQERDIEVLGIFLKQLYLKKHKPMNLDMLHSAWRTFATENGENANKKVNVVTCDIIDAFGSILPDKLMDILNKMIAEIPGERLPLQWYDITTPGSRKIRPIIERSQWFSCFLEPPPIKTLSLIAPSTCKHDKPEYVTKVYILARLRSYILEQTWWFRDQEYHVRYGVSQGTNLSCTLSDIYYQQMMFDVFGIFMKSGTLLRYVDDFIYMTKDEVLAKRFLRAVRRGFQEYNCCFGRQKVAANFQSRSCKESEWIVYLGYELNGATMEVRPLYEDLELQYSDSILRMLRENQYPNVIAFTKINTRLKLPCIVLDTKLNDMTRLCTIAGLAAKKQAERCVFFLTRCKLVQQSENVMAEIRAIVKRLERHFLFTLTPSDRKRWPDFRKNISLAIWQSFYGIFARDPQMREIYYKKMREMVLNRAVL